MAATQLFYLLLKTIEDCIKLLSGLSIARHLCFRIK